MKKRNLGILILSAGKGTRMRSSVPKVLHNVGFLPMIARVLKSSSGIKPAGLAVVLGHQSDRVKSEIGNNAGNWGISQKVDFFEQKKLDGSAGAVKAGAQFIRRHKHILILCGDAPLIKQETLAGFYDYFLQSGSSCAVLTAEVKNACNYGRIIRDEHGFLDRIVEEADATDKERKVKEINSGIYVFESAVLLKVLSKIKPKGPKREFYLTETIELAKKSGQPISAYTLPKEKDVMGINTRADLAKANKIVFKRKAEELMLKGVSFISPKTAVIGDNVEIGQDTLIYPNVFIEGRTKIGENCVIEPNVFIKNAVIGDNAHIKAGSYITDGKVGDNCSVGPYAHIRPATVMESGAKAGNFCEIKASLIGRGSKVPHLSYVGDSVLGANVNIGAGTITCNYDGVKKHKTIIGDGVFVGSNVNLVAPVKVGKGAKIGAGSTITEDIPPGKLAIARARQVIKTAKG